MKLKEDSISKKEKSEISLEGEVLYKLAKTQTKLLKEPPKIKRKTKSIKWSKIKEYEIEEFKIEDIPVKLLKPKINKNGRIILQMHGGGYIESLNEDFLQKYKIMARLYSKANEDSDVLTFDYRVAPENPYPAALEDAVKTYQWILNNGYNSENVIIAGDSAGGGLALATILYLKDHEIPMPKAIITMSAWTNLAGTGKSMKENYEIDPVFGMNEHAGDFLFKAEYAKENDVYNPYISPLYGDYAGFPKMLMQVGEKEVLLSDTLDVAEKAEKAGVDIKQTTYRGMIHDFQMGGSILPEANEAWKEIRKFIKDTYEEIILFTLRQWKKEDIQDVVKYANNPKIANNLRNGFPNPYTGKDAEAFVKEAIKKEGKGQLLRAIVIEGEVVGSIGAFFGEDVYEKTVEIGYWLAEPFWKNKIMSRAIRQMCRMLYNNYDIVRIQAEPFFSNIGSRKALENAGFELEGVLKNRVYKNGKVQDSCLYSFVK